jgi:hypothetical protein
MRRAALIALLLGLIASACGSDGSSPPATTTSTGPTRSSTSSTTPAAEGAQTAWRDVTARWQQLAPRPIPKGPAAVADDLAALLRGGDTSSVGQVEVAGVRTGEPLVVVIRETGVPDDSTAAVEYEITLEAGDEGWLVTSARGRSTCARGVDRTEPTRCV